MPRKKFTPEQRKKMLEHLESGATTGDLKREFSIKDPRTLQRQLRQAREEQTLQVARTDIIKESLREHLAEVRSLIENWSAGIKAPSPPSFSRYPLSEAEAVEQTRLFEGIREHLPFPELWRSYQAFKLKWNEYITTCEDLHHQVMEKAKEKWGLTLLETNERSNLTAFFVPDTIGHVIKAAMGESQPEALHYVVRPLYQQAPEVDSLTCNERVILYVRDAGRYAEEHRSMITEWARSEKVVGLAKLLTELRDLERRIQAITEGTLLRRDYILYSCKLCPGGAKSALR